MSKVTWATDGAPLITCSCCLSYYDTTWSGDFWMSAKTNDLCDYCPNCGDKLNADGTVDSRAELEADAAKWRAAQNKEAT